MANDVTPELLTPEVHVILLAQQKAYEADVATMQTVTILIRTDGQQRVVEATSTRVAAAPEVALYTMGTTSGVTIARFPLSAVVPVARCE